MQRAQRQWLREFNSLGLQLRPQAATEVNQFLLRCDDPQRMAENLVENTKAYLRSRNGYVDAVIDSDIIKAVISRMVDAVEKQEADNEAGIAGDNNMQDAVLQGIETADLGDGVWVYNVVTDVKPYDFHRPTKQWIVSPNKPQLFPNSLVKSKIYADRYHMLMQRLLLEGKVVTEAEASIGAVLPGQRVLTPVESLVGNPGRKLTFGLLTRLQDDTHRRWGIEDLHKVYPLELTLTESEHLLTDGCFVLVEGELVGDHFLAHQIEVPQAVPRQVTEEKDQMPMQVFGGDLSDEQLKILRESETVNTDGMYVVLCEVHLDNAKTLEKLTDVFQGYEESTPPSVYILMGSFCSSSFVPTVEGVRSYKEGFERLKFMMRSLANHIHKGTRFVFIPGPNDPGPSTLPRMPLASYLTSDLVKDIPGVVMTTNPCRIRHYSRELVFFRHDVLRLLRRHEVVPLRQPETRDAPSAQHARDEMVRFLLDQGHLVPLPLEESNILWAHDHALRLYPLPHAVFIGGVSQPFECKHQGSTFCSVGPFHRDASFYSYHPLKDVLEPCDVPDRAG